MIRPHGNVTIFALLAINALYLSCPPGRKAEAQLALLAQLAIYRKLNLLLALLTSLKSLSASGVASMNPESLDLARSSSSLDMDSQSSLKKTLAMFSVKPDKFARY